MTSERPDAAALAAFRQWLETMLNEAMNDYGISRHPYDEGYEAGFDEALAEFDRRFPPQEVSR